MSVIVELQVPADAFELGRVLSVESGTRVELETMVPTGEETVPFFWLYDGGFRDFEEVVQAHDTVENVRLVDEFEDRVMFALEWDVDEDAVFRGVQANEGQVMSATGGPGTWEFELRFPTHDALSAFQNHCNADGISLEVLRVYNPSKPDAGPWFGLTERQRETMVLAVRRGYFDVPRTCSTVELGEELGISDQSVTERLRRGTKALVTNTLVESGTVEPADQRK